MKLMNRLIDKIIAKQGYVNNLYVRGHLLDLIRFQRKLRKLFNLPKGVWEYAKFADRIEFWCIDRDRNYHIVSLQENVA